MELFLDATKVGQGVLWGWGYHGVAGRRFVKRPGFASSLFESRCPLPPPLAIGGPALAIAVQAHATTGRFSSVGRLTPLTGYPPTVIGQQSCSHRRYVPVNSTCRPADISSQLSSGLWTASESSRMGRSGPPPPAPHHRDQRTRGAPPGHGALRMRQRYPCHPKFPSSSPVWVILYRPAPSLGL